MPEGDSYTRAADAAAPILVGRVIDHVDGTPAIRRAASRLLGSTVDRVRTNGKHLLIDTDAGLTIHVWLGMPGRVRTSRGSMRPRRLSGGTRLLICTQAGSVTAERAPTVEVERTRVVDQRLDRLGADVLAEEFDWSRFRRRSEAAPADMLVCDYLLDQRVMAGIGNEYKCEILFLEGLHPITPIARVDPESRERLADRARRIMLPNAHRPQRSTTGSWPAGEAWVYGRGGKPCRRCGTRIEQGHVGEAQSRVTYWCPTCQPSP